MWGLSHQRSSVVLCFFVVIAGSVVSGCQLYTPASSPATQQPQTATPAGKILTTNAQPTGFTLENGNVLRFQTPQSKLYTEPLAFETAIQEGLGAFLISVREPSWSSECLFQPSETEQPEMTLCRVGVVDVHQEELMVSGTKVWLAVPISQKKADDEILKIQNSLRVERQ